ncbi:MAG: hypothetical protein Q7R95_05850 [bacterium]|nr:hypothetical protein [bacterium]
MQPLTIFSKKNPLQHHLYHFIIANIALFLTYVTFGTITFWEILLFFFMTFFPYIDNLTSAAIHYLDDNDCRNIINMFIAGDVKDTLHYLHTNRKKLTALIFHNLPFYLALCSLLYILIIFDFSVLFYAVAGFITHLTLDIINDQYEFTSISEWLWPILNFNFQKSVPQDSHENPLIQEAPSQTVV